ncbi:hypothetical protein ACEPU1_30995 [Pseudomonas aeruginosa]
MSLLNYSVVGINLIFVIMGTVSLAKGARALKDSAHDKEKENQGCMLILIGWIMFVGLILVLMTPQISIIKCDKECVLQNATFKKEHRSGE